MTLIATRLRTARSLSHIEFLRLCQSAGGASQAQVVAAKKDENLEYMWIIFNAAKSIERDDSDMQAGLAALDALGYLPNGASAVLDAWPT